MTTVKMNILADGRLMICFPRKEKREHLFLGEALGGFPISAYTSVGGFEVRVLGKKIKNKNMEQK